MLAVVGSFDLHIPNPHRTSPSFNRMSFSFSGSFETTNNQQPINNQWTTTTTNNNNNHNIININININNQWLQSTHQ